MNKRNRKPRVIADPIEIPARNSVWTHEDKCDLLKGLRTFGHTDIDGIATILRTKSKPAIKIMIHKIMLKAKSVAYNKSPALNCWLKSGTYDNKRPPIPELLKFISILEKHPTPEESGGFDFKAAYNYIHRMTLGLPAIDLPEGNLEEINTLIDEVRTEVWPSEKDILGYLGTACSKKPATKCYPARKKLLPIKCYFWEPIEEGLSD